MRLLLRKKRYLLPVLQVFIVIAANAASDFKEPVLNTGSFERWNSFSLGGAMLQAAADERINIAETNRRSSISQLLAWPISPGEPDLAINFYQTDQLSDVFWSTFHSSIKMQGDQSTIISGAPGETVVLSLKDFVLSGDAIFTLEGTTTTTFVINVTKRFSLSGNAQISLAGVEWSNVLFNVRGPGRPISLSGNANFTGILLANGRTVRLSENSTINGEVRDDRLRLNGSSRIIPPPIVSP
jgi:hypothetical protein